MRALLSLVVAATAVLALNQEQVNEPIAIEDTRALSAAHGGFRAKLRAFRHRRSFGRGGFGGPPGGFGGGAEQADETVRVLEAAGRSRRGRRRGRSRRRGRRNAA
ncbi:hypothetical protein LEN26_005066 [Aphanomyces euteiches]|nr:hypothetical protein AeMF1_008512 [Aphanomyces euteiches]KAH9119201.1 hypothetical protein AeMF1_007990 [Aphanomyces euteiches]KAH9120587.1 hypothetical protein AeMF1_007323 [Aphanomyces euteiches]KAH9124463.1 hypothetical protein LEN26_009704 [Aphanomyces euteiches]KAH9124464.1 hypothetical protein LEN26_009705 [Aphanomyces euteiches]